MGKEVKVIDYDIVVQVTWKCPNCDTINTTKFCPSAYRIPADEVPEDEQCPICKETFDPKL